MIPLTPAQIRKKIEACQSNPAPGLYVRAAQNEEVASLWIADPCAKGGYRVVALDDRQCADLVAAIHRAERLARRLRTEPKAKGAGA